MRSGASIGLCVLCIAKYINMGFAVMFADSMIDTASAVNVKPLYLRSSPEEVAVSFVPFSPADSHVAFELCSVRSAEIRKPNRRDNADIPTQGLPLRLRSTEVH